ncbi:MAG: hypothetical protein GX776_09725 [Oxalobacter sp.]|nr:hypothetical protein [Oxalobacter sp.]
MLRRWVVLHALAGSWAEGASREAIRERVAKAYDRYQKCGMKGGALAFCDTMTSLLEKCRFLYTPVTYFSAFCA